jgi:hypothetical protein
MVAGSADKLEEAPDKMQEGIKETRAKIADVAKELQKLALPAEGAARPEILEVLLDEDKQRELLGKLEEVMEEPECAGVKDELAGVVKRLMQGVDALQKLQEADAAMPNPAVGSLKELADARAQRATLRQEVRRCACLCV